MTPLPKKKHTRGRSNTRRAITAKLGLTSLVKCPSCGKLREPHRACPHCGFYKNA
ncbi:MAG TPA: 50S ribosomal protein L32 [Patescibacteria group bacterium]|nr:50S ribosomal protein L32 [Patescibacteria group bacterium]